jgi:hypothetical protein
MDAMAKDETKAVAHLDWRSMMSASDDTPADVLADLDKYFEPFAQPRRDETRSEKPMLCLKCDEPLTGFLASMFGRGGFTWGLAHGEGHCAGCHWPGRAHHFIKDAKGGDLVTLRNVVLQYHPDFVTLKSGEPA